MADSQKHKPRKSFTTVHQIEVKSDSEISDESLSSPVSYRRQPSFKVKSLSSPALDKSTLPAEYLEEMRGIFNMFDSTRAGRLNSSDIMRAMRELGEDLEHDEVEDMLKIADLDGDGLISFDDFVNVILR
mmetsp:Transcript_34716/g.61073  ORF Transcript_34716/g.61073 Transcript_34716/m.61073 type:complete len:130 (+) Transcript_34716:990-1379(+)